LPQEAGAAGEVGDLRRGRGLLQRLWRQPVKRRVRSQQASNLLHTAQHPRPASRRQAPPWCDGRSASWLRGRVRVTSSAGGLGPRRGTCALVYEPRSGVISSMPLALGIRFLVGWPLIIRVIIQTIRRVPSGSVLIDEAPHLSRPDPLRADQADV